MRTLIPIYLCSTQSASTAVTFAPDRKCTVHAKVWFHYTNAAVMVWVDGKQLVWWEGAPAEWGAAEDRWRLPEGGYIALGADNTKATFHSVSVRIRPVGGAAVKPEDGRHSSPPPAEESSEPEPDATPLTY